MIQITGSAAVGKTAVMRALIPRLSALGARPCAAKIDCLHTADGDSLCALGIPVVVGLSEDICPDHFLVSNLPELWDWATDRRCDTLLIETAGLCHRCSPATESSISICALDCTASAHAPRQLGPMLTQADLVVLTKIDLVSQAEREIITAAIRDLNPRALVFQVDGLVGYGIEALAAHLHGLPAAQSYEGDRLRFTMPSGVCSYCVGERRVGSEWQQGVVGKIDFDTDAEGEAEGAAEGDVSGGGPSPERPTPPGPTRRVKQMSETAFATLSILPGCDKLGEPESFEELLFVPGELYTLVGHTGAGKSRLIKDIEQLAQGDTATGRSVLIDGAPVPAGRRLEVAGQLIAHLSQNMRFTLDLLVAEFLRRHCRVRGRSEALVRQVIALANTITPEPVGADTSLHALSGGQSRALMIADIALVCDSPIVLIDEIENAGIDRERALSLLSERDKLVLIVTHDVQIALMAARRLVLRSGAVRSVVQRSRGEQGHYEELRQLSSRLLNEQTQLREGRSVA
jgi:Ni2+-binding GTPase involved in maturation of urease and hydrogenase/ABC-type lipoprotein export system ATPase subunit